MNKEKEIFIDVLKSDKAIKELLDSNIAIEFYNILYYARIKYHLSVVDMATLFNVQRQTIYNYFKLTTKELPEQVKDKITNIYGMLSLSEVLSAELEVFKLFRKKKYYELIATSDIEQLLTITKIFSIKNSGPNGTTLKLSDNYDFEKLWRQAINEANAPKDIIINNKFKSFFDNNTKEYNIELLALLTKSANNDPKLIEVLKSYLNKNNELVDFYENGYLVKDKEIIKQRFLEIISNKDSSIISLYEDDISDINNVLYWTKYTFINNTTKNQNMNFNINNDDLIKINELVVNVTSNTSLRVYELENMINMIKANFKKEIQITFGTFINNKQKDALVDIFFITN